MIRKTKFIATLGPATDSPEMLSRLIGAGVDVLRLNMSHATHDWVRRIVPQIRSIAAAAGRHTAILSAKHPPSMWAEFMKETFLTWASAGKIVCVSFGELWPARPWCFCAPLRSLVPRFSADSLVKFGRFWKTCRTILFKKLQFFMPLLGRDHPS